MTEAAAEATAPEPTESSLAGLFPQGHVVPLLKGKRAVIAVITLETILWIEREHGSFDAFQNKMRTTEKLGEMVALIFQLLENKADFADFNDFARHVTVPAFLKLKDAYAAALQGSMPVATEGGEGGEGK